MKEIIKKHYVRFILAIIFSALYSVAFVGISLLLEKIVDLATKGEVRKAVLVSAAYIIAFAIIMVLQAFFEVKLNQTAIGEMRKNIVKKVLNKSSLDFGKYKESDYVSLIQNDVKKVEDGYIETILSIVSAIVMLIFAVIVMTNYSWVFTASMFGMIVLMCVVPSVFSKKLSLSNLKLSKAQEEMTEGITEAVSGYEVIKSFGKEDYAVNKFSKKNEVLIKAASRFSNIKKMNTSVSNSLMFVMQMVICVLSGYFIYKGKISYASMVGVIQVSGSACQPIFQLFALIPTIQALKPILEKISAYTKDSYEEKETNAEALKDWNKITVKNVSFTYPGNDKETLSDVSLSIERGKKYLIVGESGSGKTTLINMLCGNFAPDKGKIIIDKKEGINVASCLKKMTSVVWQKIFLFNDSIKENILLGEKESLGFKEAIKDAKLQDMIKEKGEEYMVGSDGNLLSGGQKQRVAIARALYSNKDIIVLDEGISALDKENAEKIEESLLNNKDKTLISISHHISGKMLDKYDEVISIKGGKVEMAG
ncbi:MAG: ABC transporter ATP-binding protein/permease [Lachnospiraceae bacterium]|nr:ABC transporter ATP-binding protein/permease [Lachnospiraceae bacterium]